MGVQKSVTIQRSRMQVVAKQARRFRRRSTRQRSGRRTLDSAIPALMPMKVAASQVNADRSVRRYTPRFIQEGVQCRQEPIVDSQDVGMP